MGFYRLSYWYNFFPKSRLGIKYRGKDIQGLNLEIMYKAFHKKTGKEYLFEGEDDENIKVAFPFPLDIDEYPSFGFYLPMFFRCDYDLNNGFILTPKNELLDSSEYRIEWSILSCGAFISPGNIISLSNNELIEILINNPEEFDYEINKNIAYSDYFPHEITTDEYLVLYKKVRVPSQNSKIDMHMFLYDIEEKADGCNVVLHASPYNLTKFQWYLNDVPMPQQKEESLSFFFGSIIGDIYCRYGDEYEYKSEVIHFDTVITEELINKCEVLGYFDEYKDCVFCNIDFFKDIIGK